MVMFSPEDLKIVKESPSFRRKFLDIELCKLSKKYYYNLVQYNKVLNERNIILKNGMNKIVICFRVYDEQLSKYGGIYNKIRDQYVKKLK